jgi:hypothetical protein
MMASLAEAAWENAKGYKVENIFIKLCWPLLLAEKVV